MAFVIFRYDGSIEAIASNKKKTGRQIFICLPVYAYQLFVLFFDNSDLDPRILFQSQVKIRDPARTEQGQFLSKIFLGDLPHREYDLPHELVLVL